MLAKCSIFIILALHLLAFEWCSAGKSSSPQSSITSSGSAQPDPGDPKEAALQGLKNFNLSPDGTLADPLDVFFIRPDQLINFKSGDDPHKYINDAQRKIYPVVVGDKVSSSVVVEKVNGRWKPVTTFDLNKTIEIVSMRKSYLQAPETAQSSFFVVQIPGVQLNYLAQETDGGAPESSTGEFILLPLPSNKESIEREVALNLNKNLVKEASKYLIEKLGEEVKVTSLKKKASDVYLQLLPSIREVKKRAESSNKN
ncbi:MAG TPA: hypothetical protein VFQ92_04715 [Blastocatellia bacterium]|nr:hypothetical protein [Blastocatellia bacterium]